MPEHLTGFCKARRPTNDAQNANTPVFFFAQEERSRKSQPYLATFAALEDWIARLNSFGFTICQMGPAVTARRRAAQLGRIACKPYLWEETTMRKLLAFNHQH